MTLNFEAVAGTVLKGPHLTGTGDIWETWVWLVVWQTGERASGARFDISTLLMLDGGSAHLQNGELAQTGQEIVLCSGDVQWQSMLR